MDRNVGVSLEAWNTVLVGYRMLDGAKAISQHSG